MATAPATTANVVAIDAQRVFVRTSGKEAPSTPLGATKKPQESYTHLVLDANTAFASARPTRLSVPSLSQSELYPVRHAFSPVHIAALRLLRLATGRTQRAIEALARGDEMEADTEMQRVQVLLPELFCCRALGDGFGTVINAMLSAFEALEGNSLGMPQLRVMHRILGLLRDKPFLTVDEADQELDLLESVNLNPYPAELVEFLSNGESVR